MSYTVRPSLVHIRGGTPRRDRAIRWDVVSIAPRPRLGLRIVMTVSVPS